MSAFAIYIPCVYSNISAEMIAATFYRMKIGSVRHVEFVRKTDTQNKAYIFFESMYPFGKGAAMMREVDEGKSVKLHYSNNQHVFWVMLKSHREYDGVSRNGWYDPAQNENKNVDECKDDNKMEMTQEQIDMFPNPSYDFVSSDYAAMLEHQNFELRCQNQQLHAHNMALHRWQQSELEEGEIPKAPYNYA